MKKTIVIIALAILMVASVFADTTKDTETTTVILTLERDPTYKVAITTTPLDTGTTSTVSKDTTLAHVSNINLVYTKDTLKFAQNTSDTFYLSFLFYDYADVTLGMKINDPLTRYVEDTAQTTDDDKIDYKVTVETAKDNKEADITAFELTSASSGTKEKAEVIKYTDTKKMGEIRYASLKLTVGPTSNDQTVEGKIVGIYKSTITITATTTA